MKVFLFFLLISSLFAIDNHILFGFDVSFAIVLLITGLFLYREYVLRHQNNELNILQKMLVDMNKSLRAEVDEAVYDLEKAQSVANIGSWVHDIKKGTLTCSKQTYKICDLEKKSDDDLFERFLERIHPEDKERVLLAYENSLKNKIPYNIEHRLLLDDGSIRYVLETCETTSDANGEASISYGTVQDITKEYYARKDLEARDAYILHQARLVQMGEMLSMIAHQWRQPLATISAKEIAMQVAIEFKHYDLSKQDQLESFFTFLRKNLSDIQMNVQYLSKTISNFKDFYKPRTQAECCNINSVVVKTEGIIREALEASNVELLLEMEAKSEILLYENEFMQVILNILMNAKEQFEEFGTKNAKISLRTFEEKEFVRVEIEDNGGGIKEENIANLFDPYFSTKMEKNGTGLGLYMAKIILEKYHSGSIEVENINQGAKFTIKMKKSKECKIY